MSALFEKYGYIPDEQDISRKIEVLSKNVENVISPKVLEQCFSFMDITTLRTNDTPESVSKLVAKVNALRTEYPSYPSPASICVYPNFASLVRGLKADPSLHVTAVASCFPSAQSFPEVKVMECRMAVENGADEVDIVLALNSFLSGNYDSARMEIRQMRQAIDEAAKKAGRPVTLKVILETGLLVSPQKIADASFLAMEEGADFIKTSTGKVDVNATPAAAMVMCGCIARFYEKTGRKVGFKAAGGISNAMDAVGYYSIVSSVLGEDWLDKKFFRFGVSRLANSIMSYLEQKTVSFF